MFEIIPAIDIIAGKCVRLTKGDFEQVKVYSEDPVQISAEFAKLKIPRIHIIDLEGAKSGKLVNLEAVKRITKSLKIPVQFGGGVRTLAAISDLIETGVDRVILGTTAVYDLEFVSDACAKYKSKIVVSIDTAENRVMTDGWKKPSKASTLEFALSMEKAGVKRIIFTDISRDGMLTGPNFESITQVAASLNIPLIASGGITSLEDILKLKLINNVEGAIIGKALYEGKINLEEALKIS